MLPTEIKNKIRKVEKARNVFINNKYGIIFNETCIKEGLLPKYTNIYIYTHNSGNHCYMDKIIEICYQLRTNGKYLDFSVSSCISMSCCAG